MNFNYFNINIFEIYLSEEALFIVRYNRIIRTVDSFNSGGKFGIFLNLIFLRKTLKFDLIQIIYL